MLQRQLRRVQINACCRCAAVERVAEDWKALFGCMDPDLMRAASQRLGFDHSAADATSVFCLSAFCIR